MSAKKHRRPRNPIMRKIDDSVDWHEQQGYPVNVNSVADNTASKRLSLGETVAYAKNLLMPWVRSRLESRGYKVTDQDTFARSEWTEMGVEDFDALIDVKQQNVDSVARHLKAERDVRKYLVAQEAKLGRAVTAGEFADKVTAIYERYGVSV